MNLKISIITPSFNQGGFLEQTIDSVLSQGYENLEYVIIDGGSTDNSREIIKKYKKHLTYWTSEKDNGQSDAINKGFEKCTGDIINWINSDDYYQPGTFHAVANAFNEPSVQVLCGKGRVFNDLATVKINHGSTIFPQSLEKSFAYGRIDQPETFFRKDIFDRLMPLSTQLHYCMDKELWMKFLALFGQDGVRKLDMEIINFRLHESSKSFQYQEKFEKERNIIFLSFLRTNGLTKEAHQLESLIPLADKSSYEWGLKSSVEFVNTAYHEFMLLLADEQYFRANYNLSQSLHALCSPSFLNPESQKTFQRIKNRMQIPKSFLRFLRSFKD